MTDDEKVLVARQSGFQAIQLTENESGLRVLRFGAGGASQSVVRAESPRHLTLPYARLLPACLTLAPSWGRMLILGLGGGSLPRFFHSHFPEMTVDVVELDPAVLEIAQAHCGFEEDARLRVVIEDGRDFIESSAGGYDVIILDGFDDDSIPSHLSTLEFLQATRRALAPEGVVIANIWGPASNSIYADMLATYQAAFGDLFIFDVPKPGTKLFVGLQRPIEMTRAEVIQQAEGLSGRYGFEYDLGAEIAGFRNSCTETTTREGELLKD